MSGKGNQWKGGTSRGWARQMLSGRSIDVRGKWWSMQAKGGWIVGRTGIQYREGEVESTESYGIEISL